MSAFHRPKPLMTGASSPRQTSEHQKVCLSPPLSLSSPVIRKKAIQIPSFDEKGLILEKRSSKSSGADKSSDLISSERSGQLWWSKACHRNDGERASTLPKTKPKSLGSQSVSAKPNICISPAPEPNPSPKILTFKSKPSDSLLLNTSQLSDFYPIQHRPEPKTSVSPTLTVPVPRRSPSPSSYQCQENSTDSQQERQPSPIAKERRARSISISNTKMMPSFEVKHDVLDQRTLLDFTHPGLRKVGPMTSREVRYQTESYRKPGESQNSCSPLKKAGTNKNENSAKTKPKSSHRNLSITPIKKLTECRPRGESASETDVLTTPSNLRSKSADYTSRINPSQASDFTSIHRLFEQMHSGKRSALPVVPITSSSSEPLLVKSETRVGRFDEARQDTTLPSDTSHIRPQKENRQTFIGNSHKYFQQAGTSQKYRFSSKTQNQVTQMDVKSDVSQSDCISGDYSCRSTHFNQKTVSLCEGLNQVKTCLVTPQTHSSETAECTFSQIRPNFDLQSCKNTLNQEKSFRPHQSQKGVNFRDTCLNEKSFLGTPEHSEVPTKLPECPWPPAVTDCSFITNRSGISPKGDVGLPQQRGYQTVEETTTPAHQRSQQLTCSDSNRTFIIEDLEDPYYVTMHIPGSVYVGEYKHIQPAPKSGNLSALVFYFQQQFDIILSGAGAQTRGVVEEDSRGIEDVAPYQQSNRRTEERCDNVGLANSIKVNNTGRRAKRFSTLKHSRNMQRGRQQRDETRATLR